MIGTNRYIGSPVERIEDFRFLRGRGQFVGDLKREGMLHAAILRSPVAHGRLAAIDVTGALELPGVRTVITAKEIGEVPRMPLRLLPLPGTERFAAGDRRRSRPLCRRTDCGCAGGQRRAGRGRCWRDRSRYPGAVASPGSTRFRAMRDFAVRRDWHECRDGLYRRQRRLRSGVPRSRLRKARALRTQRHTALPMEPRGVLAEWDAASSG